MDRYKSIDQALLRSKIFIVVCTRNRAEHLAVTFTALNALIVPDGWDCEVVFVDNGSTDRTAEALHLHAGTAKIRTSIIVEMKPGLSNARNAALSYTTGGIIAFTDDDCAPQSDWLEQIAEHFSIPGSSQVLGGRVELYNPRDLPITINPSLKALLIEKPTLDLTSIKGCNLIFARSVIDVVGTFDCLMGAGARFIAAEDTDFLARCLQCGYKIAYVPSIVVLHNHGRRTQTDFVKLTLGYAVGRGAFYAKHWRTGHEIGLKHFYWEVRETLINIIKGDSPTGNRIYLFRRLKYFMSGFFNGLRTYPQRSI